MQRFCRHMAAANIATMASGGAAPLFKFYFYCQAAEGSGRALMEVLVNKSSSQASVVFKAESPVLGDQIVPWFKNSMQQLVP